MERIEKSWGYEEIIHNGTYCCKKLVYTHPSTSSLHYHVEKHECFVVAAGLFKLQSGLVSPAYDEWRIFGPGDFIVLSPGTPHRLRCIAPGFIVEASTHDDPNDCVRLIQSGQ